MGSHMGNYGSYVVDDSAWPLVYLGTHGQVNDNDYRAALDHLEKACSGSKGKYALLVNGHEGAFINKAQRKITSDMMKRTASTSAKHCFGVAVVLGNKLQQKTLSGFLFFAPMKFPLAIKGSYADAGVWLREKAQAEGLDLAPPGGLMTYVKSVDPVHLPD
jgi:hypothetical protein